MKHNSVDSSRSRFLGRDRSFLIILSALFLLCACEDVIDVELDPFEQNMVVDAWLTNQSSEQIVQLSRSQGYFDSSVPSGITNAVVYLSG